jgi:hypothetical protein
LVFRDCSGCAKAQLTKAGLTTAGRTRLIRPKPISPAVPTDMARNIVDTRPRLDPLQQSRMRIGPVEGSMVLAAPH